MPGSRQISRRGSEFGEQGGTIGPGREPRDTEKANPAAPPTREGYLMDVDPNEGGRALDDAMTNRARKLNPAPIRRIPLGGRRLRGRERKRNALRSSLRVGTVRGTVPRRVSRPGRVPPNRTKSDLGKDPRPCRRKCTCTTQSKTATMPDLADSNGLALGDDEAEEALKQMQMLVSDVDLLPPLYRSRDDGELKLRTGKPARMLRPGISV